MPHDPDFPDLDGWEPDSQDFDTQDRIEAQEAVELRVLLTGLPPRPGTRR